MADYRVSCDAGNGGVNTILWKENGRHKTYYMPSVRAEASGDMLKGLESMSVQYEWIDWYGQRFVAGDDALKTRKHIQRHMGENRYGDIMHRFLVAVSLARLGLRKGTVNLTVFVPPGMYNKIRDSVIEGFEGQTIHFKMNGDKSDREFTFEKVTVWPEGAGAVGAFLVDDEGERQATGDLFDGQVAIIDLGAYTADLIVMEDGLFTAEDLIHATAENAGVDSHIRQPILRGLKKASPDFERLTVDDIDMVIRAGAKVGLHNKLPDEEDKKTAIEEAYTLRFAGKTVNLFGAINKYRQTYANWVSTNLIDSSVLNGLRGFHHAILVGGGSVLIESHLRDIYGDKILDPRKYPVTKKYDPLFINALGGLRLTLAKERREAN